ncbi:MAG: SIS domain-containing protein [Candidatus Bruticola sp.]
MLYRKGSIFFNEMQEQPKVWRGVLDTMASNSASMIEWIRRQNFGQVVYTATSDFYNIAVSAAKITHLVSGLNSLAVTPSEIMFGRRPPYDARIRTLVVALSTPEISQELGWGVEKLKQLDPKAQVISFEAGESASLEAGLAITSIVFPSLKSNLKVPVLHANGMLLACMNLVGWLCGKQVLLNELNALPDVLGAHLKDWQIRAQQVVMMDKLSNVAFLGSGPFYGVAQEAAYLVSRIAGLPCTSNYFIEYRHGYYGYSTNQTLVVGMISNSFRAVEERVMADLAITRSHRLIVAEDGANDLMTRCDELLELKSGVSEIARVLLVLPVAQFMMFYIAMSRGVNPDNPKHLEHPRMTLKDRPGNK